MMPALPSTTRSLPIALIRARENIMMPIRTMLAGSGLTEQQWRVLRVLSEYGAQDATDLADRASLHMPSLTRITRAMDMRGLITRTRDPKDGRRQMLDITPRGAQVITENAAEAARIVDGFKARIGADNYDTLLDLLEKFSGDPDNVGEPPEATTLPRTRLKD
ncbi:MAG: homoprotocatechuate degradation operon regulator HpaR [Maritimibacter sp.]|nr:homoprotocatechuate degradation operon regulator HpaR [Maritimibacter sp.]